MPRLLALAAKRRNVLLLALVGPLSAATVTYLWLAIAFPLRGTTGIEVRYYECMPDGDRRLLGTETVSGPARIAAIVDAFHHPREDDVGTTACPFAVDLRFFNGSREIALVSLATDGCHVVEVRHSSGTARLGGRSGALVPGNDSLVPFVNRHAELVESGRRRVR